MMAPAASRLSEMSCGSTISEATAIPLSEPIGLNACERLSLLVEVSLLPSERIKGLAVVSKNARPNVRMYNEIQKNENSWLAAAGIKRKAPTAYSESPSRIPLL